MGLFSLFSKKKPEEVYKSIAQKIVVATLQYRQDIPAPNNKVSADAAEELIYLLLHLVDRQAFGLLGADRRNAIFDEVSQIVVADYTGAVLSANAPQDIILHKAELMMNIMTLRQSIYAQCESFTGEPYPGKGTMVFAFCFFVHRALGHTDREDVTDLLTGKRDLAESDLNDFPEPPEIMDAAITVGSVASELRILDDLKHLK